MDRRDFLQLMASTGALATMGGCILGGGDDKEDPKKELPDSRLDYVPREGRGLLQPYLVMPRLDEYQSDDPTWNNWAGAAWTDVRHAPHGYWFMVSDTLTGPVDVIVPVINLGNTSTRHLVIEVYEGPEQDRFEVADAELRDRRGPFTLHPGVITGYRMTFTRKFSHGASAALCYDPFHDPIHSISAIGKFSDDRKSLGNCAGILPPQY